MPEAARAGGNKELELLADDLTRHGLVLRGGFHPEPGELGLEDAGTVLLVGNVGPAMWHAFAADQHQGPDPMNRWTRSVIEPIAAAFEARAIYPFGEMHWPFQRWALRAEALFVSPLGLLIHPEYGLWHAWRAALLFSERLRLQAPALAESPCAACPKKPCLSACPVGAFREGGYEVPLCATHLAGPAATCPTLGCHARNACPVGPDWRYPDDQIRFHMAAFARSVVPLAPPG